MRAAAIKASGVIGSMNASCREHRSIRAMYQRCATVKASRSVGSDTNIAAGPFSDSTTGDNNDTPPSLCLPLHRIGAPPHGRPHRNGNTKSGSSPAVGVGQRWSPGNNTTGGNNDDTADRYRPRSIQQYRAYTVSSRTERAPQAAVLALGSIALTAKAGQYAVQAYQQYKHSQPEPPTDAEQPPPQPNATDAQDASQHKNKHHSKKPTERENVFQKYFNLGVGSKYYEGGFEDNMTRREAALILGVRESSTHKRIKEAHRKLLILNHPDTGGSTYLAGKLNEAKDLLLKGRRPGPK